MHQPLSSAIATATRGYKKGVDTRDYGLKNRIGWARTHQLQQSVKYIKQLQDAPPVVPSVPEPDPLLLTKDTRMRHVFGHPELNAQKQKQQHSDLGDLKELEKILMPKYQGVIQTVPFGPFGTVTLSHGDILEHECDALLVPMVPNFLPYRGFGLKVLEFGGPPLVLTALGPTPKLQYLLQTSN